MHALNKANAIENTLCRVKFSNLYPQHIMLSCECYQEVCMWEYHESLNLCIQRIKNKIATLLISATELLLKTACTYDNKIYIDKQCAHCFVNSLSP